VQVRSAAPPVGQADRRRGHAVVLPTVVRETVWRDLALITLGGLALRLLFIADPGHVVDLRTFGQWALAAADNPWDRVYEATNANYPPGALLVFEFIGRGYRALSLHDPLSLRIALKVPNVIFDCVGGVVLFAIAARFVDPRRALLAAAVYDFNPAIVYDSGLWGQNDSITSVSAMVAIWCVVCGRRTAAWIALAFAVLNKPPVVVLGPLFVLEAWAVAGLRERRRALVQTGLGIAAALVFGYLIALPLYADKSIGGVYSRMLAWYTIGSSLYPYTSANAFNVYALCGDFFAPDAQPIAFVPLKYWADAAFVALAGSIYWQYTRLRDGRAFVEACFLLMLAFFLVLTEMHERYLIYALAFVCALAPLERRYLWAAIALTLTQWLNLEYSLTYMWVQFDLPAGIDPHDFAPVLVHLCALTNIAVFGWGMQTYFRWRGPLSLIPGRLRGDP
jgi:dolichyl-phosphate-mannose-protein mannosyltransferase